MFSKITNQTQSNDDIKEKKRHTYGGSQFWFESKWC